MKTADRKDRRMPRQAVKLRGAFSDTEALQGVEDVSMTGCLESRGCRFPGLFRRSHSLRTLDTPHGSRNAELYRLSPWVRASQ
jgi:hypothetical protein